MSTAVQNDCLTAWQSHFAELAEWTRTRLAIKTDRFGIYSPRGGAQWGFEELSDTVLRQHFHGRRTIGLGVISPDDECLWIAIDADNHNTDAATNINLNYALVLRERLKALGFRVVIEDSDGKGGIHIWVFFNRSIPAKTAHSFAKWLVRDFKSYGLEKIESFPKSPSVKNTEKGCGNYLRVFGRHHKRPHWSRFYGESDWLTEEDSVRLLLSLNGDDPALIPTFPEQPEPPSKPQKYMAVGSTSDRDEALARDALGYLHPDCGYDDWLKIGQALHSSSDDFLHLWIEWSAGSKDFDEDECCSKWTTFHRDKGGVRLGTLFYMAESKGWQRPQQKYVRPGEKTEITRNEDGEIDVITEEIPANAVELVLDEKCVNDQVINILAQSGDLYDHNGQLAEIQFVEGDDNETHAAIHVLCLPGLRELISERCRFFVWSTDKETEEEMPSWQRIPRWVYEGILVRGVWTGIKPLKAIVNCPVLRPDGSIVQTEGYDEATGLFVELMETFPSVPDSPTAEQIQSAVSILRDVVCDFPFKMEAHRAAWISAVLTPIAREAYQGPTSPLFLFDANVRGSGKSLLGDLASLIVIGREATRFTAPESDDESRKRITALVECNDRIILIDNIVGSFGCASLDAALTGSFWKDRRLGSNTMVEAPLRMTWLGSGNNVVLAADTARRVCHVRLESQLENPEDRDGFKYPDIRGHVRRNRPALLTAALTILRGFIAAGRPDQKLKPWGSFEGWSDLVRQAVVFAGFADPGTTREELRETSDVGAGALRQILEALLEIDTASKGFSAGQLVEIAKGIDRDYTAGEASRLKETIEQFCESAIDKIDGRKLGTRLGNFRNRICGGMSLDYVTRRGTRYWSAMVLGGSGGSGGCQTTEAYAREKTDVQCSNINAHWERGVEEPPKPPQPPDPMPFEDDYTFNFGGDHVPK